MYVLENIEKFIRDNLPIIGDRATEMLLRAAKLCHNGSITGWEVKRIMRDKALLKKFTYNVMSCPDHQRIITESIGDL